MRDEFGMLVTHKSSAEVRICIVRKRWISVKERLPQATGKYLCAVKDKRGNLWTIASDWSLEMKSWFGDYGEIKNKVTHWMPLPDPPKEG